jgi:hypothetical protein
MLSLILSSESAKLRRKLIKYDAREKRSRLKYFLDIAEKYEKINFFTQFTIYPQSSPRE